MLSKTYTTVILALNLTEAHFGSDINFVVVRFFYDKTILERYFKISLGIMNIINYCWWHETLNQAIFQN
jgi:hypothetical protein